jgi:replication factor A1
VIHVYIFFTCLQGDSIYAEIPPDAIPSTTPYLEEGNIVCITKIRVVCGKIDFKAVPNPYMLKLNFRTKIIQLNNDIPGFPKYTFFLTPLDKLGDYLNKTEYFLGKIIQIVHKSYIFLYDHISNAATAYSTSGEQITRRIIKLQDLRYDI